jgi:hypothetical protein
VLHIAQRNKTLLPLLPTTVNFRAMGRDIHTCQGSQGRQGCHAAIMNHQHTATTDYVALYLVTRINSRALSTQSGCQQYSELVTENIKRLQYVEYLSAVYKLSLLLHFA